MPLPKHHPLTGALEPDVLGPAPSRHARRRATPVALQWASTPIEHAIAAASPFDLWPPDAIRRLATRAQTQRTAPGALLVAAGQPVQALHVVVSGAVVPRIAGPSGHAISLGVNGAGWTFGLTLLADGGVSPNDVLAIADTTTIAIPFGAVLAELGRHPDLWESIAVDMARRFRRQTFRLAEQALDPIRVRLARKLLQLADSHGRQADTGTVLMLRLSQERVGDMLGVARQTAALHLDEFVREGLLSWHYGQATLLDLPRLRALCHPSVTRWIEDALNPTEAVDQVRKCAP